MGKLVCDVNINGEDVPKALTTAAGVVPTLVKTTPGVGHPFWYWNTINVPAGQKIIAVDYTNAPVASNDASENASAIAAITAQPEDVLTFGPI